MTSATCWTSFIPRGNGEANVMTGLVHPRLSIAEAGDTLTADTDRATPVFPRYYACIRLLTVQTLAPPRGSWVLHPLKVARDWPRSSIALSKQQTPEYLLEEVADAPAARKNKPVWQSQLHSSQYLDTIVTADNRHDIEKEAGESLSCSTAETSRQQLQNPS